MEVLTGGKSVACIETVCGVGRKGRGEDSGNHFIVYVYTSENVGLAAHLLGR